MNAARLAQTGSVTYPRRPGSRTGGILVLLAVFVLGWLVGVAM